MVERVTPDLKVAGSIPAFLTILKMRLAFQARRADPGGAQPTRS